MSTVLSDGWSTRGFADPGSSCQTIPASDQAAVLQGTGRSRLCVRCRLGNWCLKHLYGTRLLSARDVVSHIPRRTCRTAM